MKAVITNAVPLNTGDAAILRATVAILRKAFPDLEVVAYGEQTEIAAGLYPEMAFRRSLYGQLDEWSQGRHRKLAAVALLLVAWASRFGLGRRLLPLLPPQLRASLEEYRSADIVVSSGGTYLVPHYRLMPKLFDFLVTLALGRPLVLFTQSLGPFGGVGRRWLLRLVLSRATLILVRDERSAGHLRGLGVPVDRVRVCADAAFALSRRAGDKPRQAPASNGLRIAVSVRDWPHFTNVRSQQGMAQFADAMVALVQMLVEKFGADVTFLSTCQGIPEYWTDDSRLARAIEERLTGAARSRVRVDDRFHTPEALRDRYAGYDVVIATRMHAAILALCAGTPVMPLAYEFKTAELFGRLGFAGMVPSIEGVDGATLCAAFRQVLLRWQVCGEEIWAKVAAEERASLAASEHVRAALAPAAVPAPA